MNKITRLAAAAFLSLVLAGCGGPKPDSPKEASSKFKIVFSQCNSAEPYRAVQNKIFQTAVQEKYADIVDFHITDAQQDNMKQIAQIENIILQGVDLLIVAPNEAAPLTNVVRQAHEAGIKVICLERDLAAPVYDLFVGADNVEIGEMAGQHVQKYLKSRGIENPVVVEMKGLLGTKPQQERHEGGRKFIDAVPGVKVIEDVANWLQSEAKKRMETQIQAHPKIDAVYAHNDPMAVGCYLAAREAGREGEMIFVGVDGLGGQAGGIKKVIDGVLQCTFIYPPCAAEAIDYAVAMLKGEAVPERVILKPTKITQENAQEWYMKATIE
ncbi:MAG TPA: substrate-binding domain-containing protein [Candidatus Hydrogenedentes bacterium]|jgi:ribose transport system substrate-binding protein|nr:substrate-binding domain-containing protein [Candidatus Hydrogenedentota bacterium]